MAALDCLQQVGLTLELNGDKLRLWPVALITEAQRMYVRDHRVALMAELQTANVPLHHWLPGVAQLLGTSPVELLAGGYLEPHDLLEYAWASAEQIAETIRRGPAWITRTDTCVTRVN
jgi:hypothetical protein